MQKNILIIGGGPAGVTTALTAKSVRPEQSVCVVKDIADGVIPCAIPYMIHTMSDPSQNRMGDQSLTDEGIEVINDQAIAMSPSLAEVTLKSGAKLAYDRLVLATGAKPSLPPIPGIDKAGVYTIQKELNYLAALRNELHAAQRVVVLGGGFIGAELADELSRQGSVETHLVEMMPNLLSNAFDTEFCQHIESILAGQGVQIHTNSKVQSIEGQSQVHGVVLDSGEILPADLVLVGVGGKPNVDLARKGGLRITDGGSIWVDSYMRTQDDKIFAVGDCALKRDFFTRKEVPVWLASTATAEARIAGTNLFSIRVLRQIQGTIAAFSTNIGGVSFASAGLTCQSCEAEHFRIVTGCVTAPDRHPGNLPGVAEMKVKLVFADRAGVLLGGQISGGPSVGELINAVAIGIQKGLTVRELDMMQIATHPLLTPAPTVHPLINCAHQALAKLRKR